MCISHVTGKVSMAFIIRSKCYWQSSKKKSKKNQSCFDNVASDIFKLGKGGQR